MVLYDKSRMTRGDDRHAASHRMASSTAAPDLEHRISRCKKYTPSEQNADFLHFVNLRPSFLFFCLHRWFPSIIPVP